MASLCPARQAGPTDTGTLTPKTRTDFTIIDSEPSIDAVYFAGHPSVAR
ncbi:hypothetical protein OG558_35430 [Kribbella sp. NBC_01510]